MGKKVNFKKASMTLWNSSVKPAMDLASYLQWVVDRKIRVPGNVSLFDRSELITAYELQRIEDISELHTLQKAEFSNTVEQGRILTGHYSRLKDRINNDHGLSTEGKKREFASCWKSFLVQAGYKRANRAAQLMARYEFVSQLPEFTDVLLNIREDIIDNLRHVTMQKLQLCLQLIRVRLQNLRENGLDTNKPADKNVIVQELSAICQRVLELPKRGGNRKTNKKTNDKTNDKTPETPIQPVQEKTDPVTPETPNEPEQSVDEPIREHGNTGKDRDPSPLIRLPLEDDFSDRSLKAQSEMFSSSVYRIQTFLLEFEKSADEYLRDGELDTVISNLQKITISAGNMLDALRLAKDESSKDFPRVVNA